MSTEQGAAGLADPCTASDSVQKERQTAEQQLETGAAEDLPGAPQAARACDGEDSHSDCHRSFVR